MDCNLFNVDVIDDKSRINQSLNKQTHFARRHRAACMHEFKTVVKRWILKDRYSWRPKSALNYRTAFGSRSRAKSINPGKYNDPRCDRRYKNPPLTSTSLVVDRAYGLASLHA